MDIASHRRTEGTSCEHSTTAGDGEDTEALQPAGGSS